MTTLRSSTSSPPLDLQLLRVHPWLAAVEHHAVLASTNDRSREIAALPNPPAIPLLIVADEQTSGRGRGGHAWWTGRGSLAMSLLLDGAALGISADHRIRVSLATAVAIVDTLRPLLAGHIGGDEIGLHWPNDVFVGGRKISGILVEALPDGRLIVGIGINTNNTLADAPPELRETATTIRDMTGRSTNPTQFLLMLLDALQARLALLAAQPESLGEEFRRLCLQRGRLLSIRQGDEIVTGRCHDIAVDGALILDTPQGRRAFYSGMLVNS